jgi:hypothetical protein
MASLVILDTAGPLPTAVKFNSPLEGPATFVLTATARTDSAAILTGVSLSLDGNVIGTAMCWANQNNNHMAMRTTFIPVEYLSYDTHTIELTNAYSGTITDVNDYFQVTLLY